MRCEWRDMYMLFVIGKPNSGELEQGQEPHSSDHAIPAI